MYKELYDKISRIILEYFLQGNEPDEYTDYTMEEWSHETGVDYKPLRELLERELNIVIDESRFRFFEVGTLILEIWRQSGRIPHADFQKVHIQFEHRGKHFDLWIEPNDIDFYRYHDCWSFHFVDGEYEYRFYGRRNDDDEVIYGDCDPEGVFHKGEYLPDEQIENFSCEIEYKPQ